MLTKRLVWRLVRFHFGEKEAATSRELAAVLNTTNRQIRDAVNTLRCHGVPVCRGDSGYFYASTPEELDHSIAQMSSRIARIAEARAGLLRVKAGYPDPAQTTITDIIEKEGKDDDKN